MKADEIRLNIERKAEKREKPLYFLKDMVDLTEALMSEKRIEEAKDALSFVTDAYLHRSLDGLVLFHVYADFGLPKRILALSDALLGKDSAESFGIIYYMAIESVDGGSRTDECEVYEEALRKLGERKKGFVDEKLKIYRRYTTSLRKAERTEEARKLEDALFGYKTDGIWPLD